MASWFWRAAIAAVMSFAAGSVFAHPFPAKPVHVLAPYPPGGGVDVLISSPSYGHAGNGTSAAMPDALRRAPDRLRGVALTEAGHQLDLFQQWTPDELVWRPILVANPARLYGFPN
ncbi:hypothetical protein [Bradyrhizobium cenepequi]